MGNKTSSRAESIYSGLKKVLDNQASAKLQLATRRMHRYWKKKKYYIQSRVANNNVDYNANFTSF